MPELLLPLGLRKSSDWCSVDGVIASFPQFRWRVHAEGIEGKVAFAVIGGNKDTGEVHVLAALERASAPQHEHLAGGPYGELILTFAGQLWDEYEGKTVFLNPGDVLIHPGGSIHAPRSAQRSLANFWFGYYHQPRGSKLVS